MTEVQALAVEIALLLGYVEERRGNEFVVIAPDGSIVSRAPTLKSAWVNGLMRGAVRNYTKDPLELFDLVMRIEGNSGGVTFDGSFYSVWGRRGADKPVIVKMSNLSQALLAGSVQLLRQPKAEKTETQAKLEQLTEAARWFAEGSANGDIDESVLEAVGKIESYLNMLLWERAAAADQAQEAALEPIHEEPVGE